MKRYTPQFESDGSYNERHHEKPKPRPPEFHLDFQSHIGEQMQGKASRTDVILLVKMHNAAQFLAHHGGLPPRHLARVEKQMTIKARRMIKKFKAALKQDGLD